VSNAHRLAPYAAQLARKAVTKVSDKVVGRPLLMKNPRFPWASRANASVLDRLSERGAFVPGQLRSGDLYRPEALGALLGASRRPGSNQDALLGRVITLELALQMTGTEIR
jgi:hypothetical protein